MGNNISLHSLKRVWNRKQILYIFTLILLYKITLELVYKYIISPRYFYQGFIYDFSVYKYIISTLIVILMIYPMIKLLKKGTTSSIIVLLICMAYFIPGSSLYALANLDNKFFLFYGLYWILIMFFQLLLPRFKVSKIKGNPFVFNLIIFSFAIFSLVMSGIYTDFRLNFDLSQLYDLRLQARDLNIPTIVQYLQSASTMIMPIGLIYYIVNKKKSAVFAIIFIELLEFSFAGKKSILAMVLIAILIALYFKKMQPKQIIGSFFLLNVISFIEFILRSGISEFSKYIQRRVLFMPSLISSYYFEFFNKNEQLYLRQSVLRWFGVSSPYTDVPIQRLIGLMYFGSIQNNANTGLVGDAYANFGWISLIFYPLAIIIMFRILEFCSNGVDPKISALVWVITFYKFVSGSFFTVLLNGGLLMACVTMFFCPRNKDTSKENSMVTNSQYPIRIKVK